MDIKGKRIHITGSADSACSYELLKYSHSLISSLTAAFLEAGANFLVGIGKEPVVHVDDSESLSIIFDWTILARIHQAIKEENLDPTRYNERLIYTIATVKTENQIPEHRRIIWEELNSTECIELKFLESGWTSGALRRQRQEARGDILIALSGGEGVEHLISLYRGNGKPVIPLDLQLGASCHDGSGGASKFFQDFLAQPENFLPISDTSLAGSLIRKINTSNGRKTVQAVVANIINLVSSLEENNISNKNLGLAENSSNFQNSSKILREDNQEVHKLRCEKLGRLRKALAIETGVAEKFKLENQISEEEKALAALEEKLVGAEISKFREHLTFAMSINAQGFSDCSGGDTVWENAPFR
jgi:hypothetical protein